MGDISLGTHPEGVTLDPDTTGNLLAYTMTILNYADVRLTIRKTVTGDMGDLNKPFTFTLVSVAGDDAEKTYAYTGMRDGTVKSGVLAQGNTFELAHGESIEITLPLNKQVIIQEAGENYAVSWRLNNEEENKGNRATVTLTGNDILDFINDLPAVAPTGYRVTATPYFLMFLMGVVVLALGRRRRRGNADV